MPKMVAAFVGTDRLQLCVQKYHDSPNQYKGYLKSALGKLAASREGQRPRAHGSTVEGFEPL